MSKRKKEIRRKFRETVFERDNFTCVMCDYTPIKADELDAHHIYDRTLMPNGGYVKENGITLCESCHIKAESTHNGLPIPDGFSREELYAKIKSSHEKAIAASKKLE